MPSERMEGAWGFLVAGEIPDAWRQPGDVAAFFIEGPDGRTLLAFMDVDKFRDIAKKIAAYEWKLGFEQGVVLN